MFKRKIEKTVISLNKEDNLIFKDFMKIKKGVHEQLVKISNLSYSEEEKRIIKRQIFNVGIKRVLDNNKKKLSKKLLSKIETEEEDLFYYLTKFL